jgi:hypothetical protein
MHITLDFTGITSRHVSTEMTEHMGIAAGDSPVFHPAVPANMLQLVPVDANLACVMLYC